MTKSNVSRGEAPLTSNKQRKTYRRWTKKETAYLRARYPYETAEQIGTTLNRTKEEVYNKLKHEREYNKSNPYKFKKKTFPNRKKRSCYSLNSNVVPINASVSVKAPSVTPIQAELPIIETTSAIEEVKTKNPITEEEIADSIKDIKVEIPEVQKVVEKVNQKVDANIIFAMINSTALIISFFAMIIALIR